MLKRHRLLSVSGLKVKGKAPGNALKLTKEQFENLKTYLLEGALAHDYPTDNWSRERIVQLIKAKFGVSFQVSHASKLTRKIGLSLQKPKTRSYRKDEAVGQQWKKSRKKGL